MNSEELVLCSPAHQLPGAWLPAAGYVPLAENDWVAIMNNLEPVWIRRSMAESDPAYLQWIPYVLLQRPDGALAAYPRQGGESRLHGLWSVGLGGHLNPEDAPAVHTGNCEWSSFWLATVHAGLQRELAEEYPGTEEGLTTFLGLIHENQTAVGRVHLGLVFLHRLLKDPGSPSLELAGLQWIPAQAWGDNDWPVHRFELWSRLAWDLMQMKVIP